MTFRDDGMWCNVCGHNIGVKDFLSRAILDKAIGYTEFMLKGSQNGMMHCCDECLPALKRMTREKDYTVLPEGPLRKAYEETVQEERYET